MLWQPKVCREWCEGKSEVRSGTRNYDLWDVKGETDLVELSEPDRAKSRQSPEQRPRLLKLCRNALALIGQSIVYVTRSDSADLECVSYRHDHFFAHHCQQCLRSYSLKRPVWYELQIVVPAATSIQLCSSLSLECFLFALGTPRKAWDQVNCICRRPEHPLPVQIASHLSAVDRANETQCGDRDL